jgi:hypothetical protein
MRKDACHTHEVSKDDRHSVRVIDNFPIDPQVTPEELAAIEAFLMPLVQELLSG